MCESNAVSRHHALIRIVDDDAELRNDIELLLQLESWHTETYADAEDFLARFDTARPGCIVLDIRMPGMSGSELQERLVEVGCRLPVIVLTGHGDMDLAIHSFRLGATDFLQKPLHPEELLRTVAKAANKDWTERQKEMAASPLARFALLTEAERAVLRKVAQGLSNLEIASAFGRSERTIERHRANAMKKLGLHKPAEAAAFLEAVDNDAASDLP